jgi:epoxyqueuosine reductase QueG
MAAMSDTDFDQFFAGSPIRRIGADHMRRNIQQSDF